MVLTTRHHDGFCLFDSKCSNFTSVKTASKRDFVNEFVNACRKHNMRMGFYYSLLDWRFPGYHDRGKYPGNFREMVEQVHCQVRELMSNYGKIDYLFYDGEWIPGLPCNRTFTQQKETPELAECWKSRELNAMVRNLQPGIIINNRSGLSEDVDTPEQYVVSSEESRAWESCMTIGDSIGWGYVKHNPNLKSVHQLIQYLVQTAGSGGNYLLNIGPKPDGSVEKEILFRLQEIGKWMKRNGESVYGSDRLMPPAIGNTTGGGMLGMLTSRGNILYLHVFRWPGKEAVIPGIKNRVLSARILATGKNVNFTKQENTGKIYLTALPQEPPDGHDSVIALQLEGKPEYFDYAGMPL